MVNGHDWIQLRRVIVREPSGETWVLPITPADLDHARATLQKALSERIRATAHDRQQRFGQWWKERSR